SDDDDDGDGLTSIEEFQAGTDPENPDSDLDGVEDGVELGATDPIDASDNAPLPATAPTRYTMVGEELVLDASASLDPNDDALSYDWTVVDQPATSTAAVSTPQKAVAGFSPDIAGEYELQLEVDDGATTRTATVTVHAFDGLVVPDDADTVQ